MDAEHLEKFKKGLTCLLPILPTLDIRKESDKFQFCSILEYYAIFTNVIEKGKKENDPDIINCIPDYVKLSEAIRDFLDVQIENLKKKKVAKK